MRLVNGQTGRHHGQARRRITVLATAFGLTLLAPQLLVTAPQAELWPRWEAHTSNSQVVIDHSDWGTFLDRYLITDHPDGVHLLPYSEVSGEDRRMLQDYLAMLEKVAVSELNRDEQMAYWLNLYNALTVELILEHYPVDSIRDIKISGPVFNRHPWDAKLVQVEGEELSLNDIEHRIMRPIWQDPRIHYGVNCASIGCPNLMPIPFTAANYRELFDQAAHEYVNHPRGVRFTGSRPHLSSIYTWYEVDFGDDLSGVIDHLLLYAEEEPAAQLRQYRGAGYRPRPRYDYDWALNEP